MTTEPPVSHAAAAAPATAILTTTRDAPTFRHWCSVDGYERAHYAHPTADPARRFPAEQPSGEVIIETASAETASNLVPLIHGGILLGYPDTHKSPDPGEPYSLEHMPEDVYALDRFARLFEWYQGVHYGRFPAQQFQAQREPLTQRV